MAGPNHWRPLQTLPIRTVTSAAPSWPGGGMGTDPSAPALAIMWNTIQMVAATAKQVGQDTRLRNVVIEVF